MGKIRNSENELVSLENRISELYRLKRLFQGKLNGGLAIIINQRIADLKKRIIENLDNKKQYQIYGQLPNPVFVALESPYAAGDVKKNISYAKKCLKDSLMRGEYPIASHLLYTRVLDDTNKFERKLGIAAGLNWNQYADKTVVYTDLGISEGMKLGIQASKDEGRPVEYRQLKHK